MILAINISYFSALHVLACEPSSAPLFDGRESAIDRLAGPECRHRHEYIDGLCTGRGTPA